MDQDCFFSFSFGTCSIQAVRGIQFGN